MNKHFKAANISLPSGLLRGFGFFISLSLGHSLGRCWRHCSTATSSTGSLGPQVCSFVAAWLFALLGTILDTLDELFLVILGNHQGVAATGFVIFCVLDGYNGSCL